LVDATLIYYQSSRGHILFSHSQIDQQRQTAGNG
jgi:hypothetical protein